MVQLALALLTLYFTLALGSRTANFGCLNHEGVFVDWWVIYKETGGERYIYKDSRTVLNLNSDRLITDANSPLVQTILSSGFASLGSYANSPFYTAWNDQPIKNFNGPPESAHAKGFMGIRNTRSNLVDSFFIQHSLPRFPFSNTILFDSNIKHKAQHFMCVSMRDEFTGQDTVNEKLIQIDKVKDCNFFKLLWHYSRTVNVNFLTYGLDLDYFAQISPFKEILRAIPNFPIRKNGSGSYVDNISDLSSFIIESTGDAQTKLTFQIFAKAPGNSVDIYDDVTSLFSIHHEDYNYNEGDTSDPKTANWKGKTSMLMIAQSHADPATLGINQKILVDQKNFFATVHILNSALIKLPADDGELVTQTSMYRDHSKWSVNVVYGVEGDFPPLLCFYDLNRSTKQAMRGGGAFCLNSSVVRSSSASLSLWEMFMSFYPDPTSMARFNNAQISGILGKVLPKEATSSNPAPFSSPTDVNEYLNKLRSSSNQKRRLSISGSNLPILDRPTTLSKVTCPDSRDGSSSKIIHVLYPGATNHAVVPCPYKFNSARNRLKRDKQISTSTILKIAKTVSDFGFTKLNLALLEYDLKISPLNPSVPFSSTSASSTHQPAESMPFQSPLAERTKTFHSSDFTFGTVYVNRHEPSLTNDMPESGSNAQGTGAVEIVDQLSETTQESTLYSDDESMPYSLNSIAQNLPDDESTDSSLNDYNDPIYRLTHQSKRRKTDP